MKIFSYHKKDLPYFIQYYNNGWAIYNREYRNILTGIKLDDDLNPETFTVPINVLLEIDADEKFNGTIKKETRIYLHNDDNVKQYKKRVMMLLNNISPNCCFYKVFLALNE